MLYICYITYSLCTSGFSEPGMRAQVLSRHGKSLLEISEWRGLDTSKGFCVLLYTQPDASRLTSPMTANLTSELEFSFKSLFLLTAMGTYSWQAPFSSGLMSQNMTVYSHTSTGKKTQLLHTLAEDQTDDNVQNNDISVTAVNHKPNFKIRLNTVK